MNHRHRRRGYFLADALMAFGILTAIAVLLIAGRSAAQRAGRAADDARAAVRLAESYLAENTAANSSSPPEGISVASLATPAPAGWRWVSVHATVNKQSAELVGLVRSRP